MSEPPSAARDDDIFGDALELPPAQRAAFLERACAGDSDAARRTRLERLLAAHAEADAFLRQPAFTRVEPPRAENRPAENCPPPAA